MIQAATTSRQPRSKAPGWYHMVLPLRRYRVDDGFLRQYVFGDGIEVGRAQIFEAILNRLAHCPLDFAAVRRRTGLQQLDEAAAFPPADAGRRVRGDVGNRPSVGPVLGAGELGVTVACAEKVARGMALCAS